MDRTAANFLAAVDQMRSMLGANAAAIQLPYGEEDNFKGVYDLIEMKLRVYQDDLGKEIKVSDIPEDMLEKCKHHHNELIERLAEVDDEIMEKFLQSKAVTAAELRAAIRRTVIVNKLTPVLCGASFKNKGIQFLLDAVVDFLPSPKDLPPIKGTNPETSAFEEILPSDKAPFCALSFKVATDPFVGRLNYVRVYSGTLSSGSYVYNVSKRERERVAKIVRMHSNRQEIIDHISSGDIAALVGLKETKTGDTLCDEKTPILIEAMRFTDQEKLGMSLHKLAEEDPSFRIHYNQETGQTIISGMGQLHLEVLVDRLKREFNVNVQVGFPEVAYRETLTRKVSSSGKFIQQSGGRGQYGHAVIEVEPQEAPGAGITFENKIKGGAIPQEFINPIKAGIFATAKSGVLAGYPITDIKVTLVDGSYHEVDSSELAFKMAAGMALSDAMRKGHSILLEPIMDMEITVPEEYMGQVIGDLSSRRAKIVSINTRANVRAIRSDIPLAEIFNYATVLRSLTQGRASYTMEPSFYHEVPAHIAEKIISGYSSAGTTRKA